VLQHLLDGEGFKIHQLLAASTGAGRGLEANGWNPNLAQNLHHDGVKFCRCSRNLGKAEPTSPVSAPFVSLIFGRGFVPKRTGPVPNDEAQIIATLHQGLLDFSCQAFNYVQPGRKGFGFIGDD
jgi:hypothetical protein